jgi:hypothetical protein
MTNLQQIASDRKALIRDNAIPRVGFCTKLRFKESLANGTSMERNAYASWRQLLESKEWFIIQMCESAFAIVSELGEYHDCHYISGDPLFLFEIASDSNPLEHARAAIAKAKGGAA